MRFSVFIEDNLDAIVAEWETFARTLLVSPNTMSALALRGHSREILLSVVKGMEMRRTVERQTTGPDDMLPHAGLPETAAATHGALRHLSGFDLVQVVAEFHALRASVLILWHRSGKSSSGRSAQEENVRFNETIDNALAESIESYSTNFAASRDMFLAVVGHDLRGLLSSINMSGMLLGRPDLSETGRQNAVLRIKRASQEMSGLITDLLEPARRQLGAGISIERSLCDLRSVCEEAIGAIRTKFPGRQFVARLCGNLSLEADAPRLQQVLSSLLHNAIHSEGQGEPVSLDAFGEENAIVLKVSNFGPLIPADALHTIFEPVIRAPSAAFELHERSRARFGTGLFIVREIVLGHDGTIDMESRAETGTVFTIRLPRTARRCEAVPAGAALHRPSIDIALAGDGSGLVRLLL